MIHKENNNKHTKYHNLWDEVTPVPRGKFIAIFKKRKDVRPLCGSRHLLELEKQTQN